MEAIKAMKLTLGGVELGTFGANEAVRPKVSAPATWTVEKTLKHHDGDALAAWIAESVRPAYGDEFPDWPSKVIQHHDDGTTTTHGGYLKATAPGRLTFEPYDTLDGEPEEELGELGDVRDNGVDHDDPEALALAAERSAALDEALGTLDPRWSAVLWRIAEGESLRDIGADLGVAHQMVAKMAEKAREALRRQPHPGRRRLREVVGLHTRTVFTSEL